MAYTTIPFSDITLLPGILLTKREANRRYLMKLESDNLIRNYYLEAGLWTNPGPNPGIHGGWETPTSQLRGHFLGHWLSAAAMLVAATGDVEVKGKADALVSGLARCQRENGGEWAGSIPEKYFEWIARGKDVWAPHYTVHKTFMGLLDMFRYTGNREALEIAEKWAQWFYRWTKSFSREQMDDILDYETGGMLEVWADLLAFTGKGEYRELMDRYYRRRLFDPLLAGKEVLTNMHMNTTIPEVLGAARAWEVTGEQRWMDIVRAYWEASVTNRGQYATGAQSCGEIWSPAHELSARLGDKNQEHCTIYNMMRLADFLFRWTGETRYADYWELNLYNGIFAQGYWEGVPTHGQTPEHPMTGLISYFLPLRAGAHKGWASETQHFFCCHGTLVQANSSHVAGLYYASEHELAVCQYFPSEVTWKAGDVSVKLRQEMPTLGSSIQAIASETTENHHRPMSLVVDFTLTAERETEFTLSLRIPAWVGGQATLTLDGRDYPVNRTASGFVKITRAWKNDSLRLELPRKLEAVPLPDDPETVAFREGPVVLAGLVGEDRILHGDRTRPLTMLQPDNEKEWRNWLCSYRTRNQDPGFRFIPLYKVGYERYSVYFQVKNV